MSLTLLFHCYKRSPINLNGGNRQIHQPQSWLDGTPIKLPPLSYMGALLTDEIL